MRVPPLLRLLPLMVVCVSCSSAEPRGNDIHLPSFRDVTDAPAAIQAAARAVVRIGTGGELGTGSFISPGGLLLTNNHILGVDVCPVEGCYASIGQGVERGAPPTSSLTVFVIPQAVDVGLDIAVVQVFSGGPGGAPLSTPDYLTIDSDAPASLQGTRVNVVGHPDGHLKKWSQGEVIDTSGTWITTSAYSLPGNSGSPYLNDAGHLVGILHRGPSAQDLVTNRGVDVYSIGTASAALKVAMGLPLPAAIVSTAGDATDDAVVRYSRVYLNSHTAAAAVNGAPKPVLTSLAAACDVGLARKDYRSPEDLAAALSPCDEGSLWIDCRADASSAAFHVCPADAAIWSQRYRDAFDHWRALNGSLRLDLITFATAALQTSSTAGAAIATQNLQTALVTANAPFDFTTADYLAAFGVTSYAGTETLAFVLGYSKFPDYGLVGNEVASAALWLARSGTLSTNVELAFLQNLANDDSVDLGAKLYIEEVRYEFGVLH